MGIINPELKSANKDKTSSKKLISDALRQLLKEEVEVGAIRITKAQALSKRLVDIALFCDSPKTAVTAAKVIMEFTEGKPAVQDNKEKEALPVVEFVVKDVEDAEVIRQKAIAYDTLHPEDKEPSIDLGNGMELKP